MSYRLRRLAPIAEGFLASAGIGMKTKGGLAWRFQKWEVCGVMFFSRKRHTKSSGKQTELTYRPIVIDCCETSGRRSNNTLHCI